MTSAADLSWVPSFARVGACPRCHAPEADLMARPLLVGEGEVELCAACWDAVGAQGNESTAPCRIVCDSCGHADGETSPDAAEIGRLKKLLAECTAERDHLRRREADIIEACERVADGGQYRADIVSAIQRIRSERDGAQAQVARAATPNATAAAVEAIRLLDRVTFEAVRPAKADDADAAMLYAYVSASNRPMSLRHLQRRGVTQTEVAAALVDGAIRVKV